MKELLQDISDYLKEKYSFFQHGFANVVKPDDAAPVMDENLNKYVGISDTFGNYFYIRTLQLTDYEPVRRGARVAFYNAQTRCRIVFIGHFDDTDDIKKIAIDGISAKGHVLNSIDTDLRRIFQTETGKPLDKDIKLNLLAVDFTVSQILSSKLCELNPCNC